MKTNGRNMTQNMSRNDVFWTGDGANASSVTDKWDTPQDLLEHLSTAFSWDLDVCASYPNVCEHYYSESDNGLMLPWVGLCWCNPPYGKTAKEGVGAWLDKGALAATQGATVVFLLPSRTGTRWFHKAVCEASLVVFIKGRLKYGDQSGSAPFDSCIIVYGELTCPQVISLSSLGWAVLSQPLDNALGLE